MATICCSHANMANPGFTMLLWQPPSVPRANMANTRFYHVATPQTHLRRAKYAQDPPRLPKDAPKASPKLDFWWFGKPKLAIFR